MENNNLTGLLFVSTIKDSASAIKESTIQPRLQATLKTLSDGRRGWKHAYTMCAYTRTRTQCLCKHHMAKPCNIKLANPGRGIVTLVSHTQKSSGHPSKIYLTERKMNPHSWVLHPLHHSKGYCPIFPSNDARRLSL